jgi:hypothetical protein
MPSFNLFKALKIKLQSKDCSVKSVFDHYFFDLKYYLHRDASIDDFSIILNVSADIIEQITSNYYDTSFQKIINEYRFKHLLIELDSPLNNNLSIDSIVKLSGFGSIEKFADFFDEKNTIINKII